MSKPRVLILGGAGFIGRNLVKYLVDNDLTSYIRVVDKTLLATSSLHPVHEAAFASSNVQFMQADLSRQGLSERIFASNSQYIHIKSNMVCLKLGLAN
jgi:dTDP-D-glucose 4,6-dehydratase